MIWVWICAIAGLLDVLLRCMLAMAARQRTSQRPEKVTLPASVLIAAHNEAANLQAFLPTILDQEFSQEWEVIVMLDRCTDDSRTILESMAESSPQLRWLEISEVPAGISPKKNAIQAGIEAAQYEALVFTDADCKAGKQWLSHMVAGFSQGKSIVLGIGRYARQPGPLNAWARFETFWTALQYVGLARLGLPYMGVGRNLAYKKTLFTENGGFGKHGARLSGDDDLFVNAHATASNTSVVTQEASQTISVAETTVKDWLRQKLRHFSAGPAYNLRTQIILGLLNGLHAVFFLSLFTAVYLSNQNSHLAVIYLCRIGILMGGWAIIRPPLWEVTYLWALPVLDALLWIYSILIAPAGFVLQPKWKAD